MIQTQPHFLLFCDTRVLRHRFANQSQQDGAPSESEGVYLGGRCKAAGFGRWQFVLERLDGSQRMEVADGEPEISDERLELLAVVRGLEALDQPSQVTLVTTSRYVTRGLRYGLSTWREKGYMWERFGERRPIRNADLWKRIDQAMAFHTLSCRLIRSAVAAANTTENTVGSDNGADPVLEADFQSEENRTASQSAMGGSGSSAETVTSPLAPLPNSVEMAGDSQPMHSTKCGVAPSSGWWQRTRRKAADLRNRWQAKPALLGV